MDTNDLVELAAAISGEGRLLLSTPGAVSASGLAAYWAASKCRQLRWSRRLKSFRQRSLAPAPACERCWRAALPLCREVLASEVLTRVCAGFWAVFDRLRGSREAEPLARSVWIGHLEARHGVLNLLACGNGLPIAEAEAVDRLRRASERWSDLLLAPFMPLAEVTDLAHDKVRLADFAEDVADERRRGPSEPSKKLWNRSRIDAFASCRRLATFNADLNAQIGASILSCFDLDGCDDTLAPSLSALSRSLLCQRLTTMAADAQLWIAGLLVPEAAVRPSVGR